MIAILSASLGGEMLLPLSVNAADDMETALERIVRTRKLTVGARANTLPFSDYSDNQWRGYAIDLMQQIRADLARELRYPIELEIKEVDIDERTTQLTEGNVDLICDATSFARSRALEVDFSVGYFQTGTQLLFNTAVDTAARVSAAYADSALIIGVVSDSTNQAVIERRLQIAQFVEFPSRADGWTALQQGRIDALASDGILLEAMQQASPSPENYVIAPPQPYDQEIYACMLAPNQPEFQSLVNQSLENFMQGVLNCQPDDLEILNTWFGETETGIPIDWQPLWELFQRQVNSAQANNSQANGTQDNSSSGNDAAITASTPAQCFNTRDTSLGTLAH